MTGSEMIWAATYAIGKGMDLEQLKYSDEMYGKEKYTDVVWEYVQECKDIGMTAFKAKYKEFAMYI